VVRFGTLVAGDLRRFAAPLALADILYKVAALVLLGPLGAVLFLSFVAFSGREVLADEDILFFFLHPLGWLTLFVVGGVLLATIALELACLMAIADSGRHGTRLEALPAIRFAFARAVPVLALSVRMIGRALTVVGPALAVIAITAVALLGDHDINYYLARRPPELWYAAATVATVVALAGWLLGRMLIGWAYALPLLLFEARDVAAVLAESRALVARQAGRRRALVERILAWFVGWLALSGAASAAVTAVGSRLVPVFSSSLPAVVLVIGGILVANAAVGLFVSLVANALLAIVLVRSFREAVPVIEARAADGPLDQAAGEFLPAWLADRRIVLGAALAMAAVAVTASYALVDDVRLEDHTEIMAHRGASAAAPENTLAAVERAIADGADWVEIDVQETADGEVVVIHDKDLMKLGGVPLVVADSEFAALARVDIGSRFAPEFADQRVPRLAEVLAVCNGRIRVNVELKYYGTPRRLEERVAEIVEGQGMASDIVVMSLSLPAVRRMKVLRPRWTVGLLTAVTLTDLVRLEVDFLAVQQSLATRRFVRAAHAADKQVYAWTVNEAVGMSALIGRGVDRIITDEPALAARVLAQRKELGSAERLLAGIADVFGLVPEEKVDATDPG
jgi:glycerophosphoryl diester phosphodiesterase